MVVMAEVSLNLPVVFTLNLPTLAIFTASYTCNNNQPWAVDSNLSYGFVAGKVDGKSEAELCCACYEITFTSGPVVNKKMVVQITNTGADLDVSRQFTNSC